MALPLTNKLKSLMKENPISMHVPGHKNNTIGSLDKLNINMDMTEITGLDDLHHPEEVLYESMANITKHKDYDAFYLVNGTTSGILSVIQAFAHTSGDYIIPRNAHKSVFHGLEIARGNALLLGMDISSDTYQYLGPTYSNVDYFEKDHKLAVYTYPNYYGECFDIKPQIEHLHKLNIPVLVDEAHGAHFDLEGFPQSTLNFGADFVVQSYHKTLPSLTMSSVLFIHKDAPLRQQVINYLSYFQSSSPSYLLMSSLELAHHFYETYKSDVFFDKRQKLIDNIEQQELTVTEVDDPLKLCLSHHAYDGYELQAMFETHSIFVELADEHQVLFVLPLWHQHDTYPFNDLLNKIKRLKLTKTSSISMEKQIKTTAIGHYKFSANNKTRTVKLEEAENKILATHIVPYPPGIPIMLKGEKITANMVKLLRYWSNQKLRVEGIKNNYIEIKDE
jgi:arginine/lysine/ornithine decarboxylase